MFILLGSSRADLPENDSDYRAWELEMFAGIERCRSLPPEESIPKLSFWMMQLSYPRNRERGERPVFRKVQTALLAIPDHAKYHGERILEAQREVRKAVADPETHGPAWAHFERVRTEGFETLKHLPSPETVRVLGDMLSNEWRSPIPIQSDLPLDGPLAHYALRALAQVPLVNKPAPVENSSDAAQNLRTWQLWYEQVKAGTRTFRFEGDPKEYSLRGGRAAVIDGGPGGRSRTRPAEEPAAVPKEPGEGAPVAVIAIAGLLVLLSALFFFRGRKVTADR
jgi:hypothetical protein